MNERIKQRIYISLLPNLNAREALRLENAVSPSRIGFLGPDDISHLIGRSYRSSLFDRSSLNEKACHIMETVESGESSLLHIGDASYPKQLRNIYDPPYLMYCKGSMPPQTEGIALIGTRRASTNALRRAFCMGASIGLHDIPLYSGLAYGIDSAAHRGAISAGGKTWAVIGSGLDRIYPKEHIGLAMEMIDSGGGIITEFPHDMGPARWTFPKRNRIVSGLSRLIYLMEAPRRSGAMITADFALEQGREVLVDGYGLTSRRSEGTVRLAEDGAVVIDSFPDLLRAFGGNDTIRYQVTENRPPEGHPVIRRIRFGSSRFYIWRSHGD